MLLPDGTAQTTRSPQTNDSPRIPRTRPQSTRNNHGKQIQDRRGEAKAEVLLAGCPPLHAVRPSACRVPEVRHVPNLLPQTC